jgi:hypothetical protein
MRRIDYPTAMAGAAVYAVVRGLFAPMGSAEHTLAEECAWTVGVAVGFTGGVFLVRFAVYAARVAALWLGWVRPTRRDAYRGRSASVRVAAAAAQARAGAGVVPVGPVKPSPSRWECAPDPVVPSAELSSEDWAVLQDALNADLSQPWRPAVGSASGVEQLASGGGWFRATHAVNALADHGAPS